MIITGARTKAARVYICCHYSTFSVLRKGHIRRLCAGATFFLIPELFSFLWRWEGVSSPRKRSNHDPSREASREKKDELSGSKNPFETWGRDGVRCLKERVKATTEAWSLNSRLHLPIWELAWVEPLDYEVFSKVLWQLTREIYQSDESALTQL